MQPRRLIMLIVTLLAITLVSASCTSTTEGETPSAPPTSTTAPTEPANTPAPSATPEPATPPPATATPVPTVPAGGAGELSGAVWVLVSLGPTGAQEAVVGGSEITLSLDDLGQAGGFGGCNTYGGRYEVAGERISFAELTSTLRACTDEAMNEQEGRYLAALSAAVSFDVSGASLTITYDDGRSALTFNREGTATPTPVSETGPPVQLRELFMMDARGGWALGQIEGELAEQLLFTADGGESWQRRTPPGVSGGSDMEQTVSASAAFASAQQGWVSYLLPAPIPPEATPVVWRTEDGGDSWEASAPLDLSGMPYEHFVPSDLGFLDGSFGWMLAHLGVGMSHDYITVYTTSDGGATWQRVTDPESSPEIQACNKSGLVFTGERDAWLSGDCPGLMPQLFLYRTTDGGATWSPVLLPLAEGQTVADSEQLGDSCGVRQMVQVEAMLLLALHCYDFEANTSQGWLYSSEDGESWSVSPLPANNGLFDFASPLVGWYLGEGQETAAALYQTYDGGQSWALLADLDKTGRVAFVDAQHGWVLTGVGVGDAPELWRLSRESAEWEQLNPVVVP